MLDDAFADFKRQIDAGKIQIALLELLDNAQRLQIVIEARAVRAHQLVELLFPGMAKRRMPDIVNESKRLGKLRVQPKSAGYGASDLRNFQSVRESVTKVIGVADG